MLLPGLSLNDQNTLNASRGVSDTNVVNPSIELCPSVNSVAAFVSLTPWEVWRLSWLFNINPGKTIKKAINSANRILLFKDFHNT